MKHRPKVLLACPIAQEKEYCFDFFAEQILNFDYDNYEILLVDNSNGYDFKKKIKAKGINVIHQPRGKKFPTEFICDSMNTIRDYFLKGNYDYLFILEADVFVPKDTIQYLVNYGLPVHNITYFIDGINGRTICLQSINRSLGRTKILEPECAEVAFTGEVKEFIDYQIDANTTLIGSGYGCTLIAREVVRHIPFRIEWSNDKKMSKPTFPDTYFHLDLNTLGIANYLNTERLANHYNSKWKV